MAVANSNTGNTYNRTFIPNDQLPSGTGAASRFATDITGQLIGIESRTGTYTITDYKTGQVVERPNSWTAHFADGSMFAWPTHVNKQGKVQMWDKFDKSIDLAQVIQQGIPIHIWKDEKKFTHLELAVQVPFDC